MKRFAFLLVLLSVLALALTSCGGGASTKIDVKMDDFSFTPDQPVASKELSLSGDLEVNVDFANRETAQAVGRFENKRIEVELSRKLLDGKVKRLRIRWDALGKLVSQSRLD